MSTKILWLDTETTGTDPMRHGIIQLAGIIEIDGNEMSSFDFHVRPFEGDIIDDTALSVNGISRDQLAGFTPSENVHAALIATMSPYVDKYNRADKFIFAGYNAQFDLNFMHAFFEKCSDPYLGSWIWWPGLDVSVLAMQHLMDIRHTLPNFKLATLANHFNIVPDGNIHDALTDIRMTRNIYRMLFGDNKC